MAMPEATATGQGTPESMAAMAPTEVRRNATTSPIFTRNLNLTRAYAADAPNVKASNVLANAITTVLMYGRHVELLGEY